MAVFRIEKTRDYTVMANHHLRNTKLSLKAKGLLSLMLSLPEDWDYTTKGLAKICKDGVDSICSTVNELEEHGYVIRERIRNAKGQLTDIQYTILEQPKPPQPGQGKGKQTLKELMKHNTGVSNLEITNDNIRAFSATAKKYGIDFALKKDSSTQPPRYLVFFKGRDADVMTAAFKEFSAKQLSQEKKPSIRKLLSSMKELAQKKDKVLDRTKHKDRGMEL